MVEVECVVCSEYVGGNPYECEYCGDVLCESCYFEYDEYCRECLDLLKKEKKEEEKELWNAFWASKFQRRVRNE